MNPVRGGGSASELTMTSWSALATTTRSSRPSGVVSSSSAVRRSTEVRSSMRTIRASAPGAPEMSPTSATRSPTTTRLAAEFAGPHRGDDHVVAVASVRTQLYRPRSTVITNASIGVVVPRAGCGYGGGRTGPGRTRTSSSSYSRCRARQVSSSCRHQVGPELAGTRAASSTVHATSDSATPGDGQADDRARRGPSGGRRTSRRWPPQRSGPDGRARPGARPRRRRAARQLAGERGEPVGLVARGCARRRAGRDGRVGERGQRREHRGQLADLGQVGGRCRAPRRCRARSGRRPVRRRPRRPAGEQLAQPVHRLPAVARPAGSVTAPPVTSAAAKNGAAPDRSGSMSQARPRSRPGSTAQTSGTLSSTAGAGRAQHRARSSAGAARTAPAGPRAAAPGPR